MMPANDDSQRPETMTFDNELQRFDNAARLLVKGELSVSYRSSSVPESLITAIDYAIAGEGKRIRPILVYRAAAAIVDGAPPPALDYAALALELVHTYSLIHDDLPAMDDDDLRRGRPTLHRAFNEATAILVGDGLQVQAFSMITHAPGLTPEQRVEMIARLAEASGFTGMVGGQYRDMEATGTELGLAELQAMHAMKTGALIRAAVQLGGIAAGGNSQQLQALDAFAQHIGLAFQVVDDILDVESDSATLGKTGGKDEATHKATYVSLLGLEGARKEAARLLGAALAAADVLGSRAEPLREVAHFIVQRKH